MTKPSDIIPGRTVYIVGGGSEYANWCQACEVDTMEEATFCLWTGGQDVSSHLYGKRKHYSAYSSMSRDQEEIAAFEKALRLGKPMLGTCRGHQFLTVMAGGQLVQDQMNPQLWHPMETVDGKTIYVTSTHHQAAWVWDMPPDRYKVLGWTVGISPYHRGETDADELVIGRVSGEIEIEECYYPAIRALGLQHHTEMAFYDYGRDKHATEYIDHSRSVLNRLLDGSLV